MSLLIGIIQSFLNATGMIFTKKIVENKLIGNNLQTLISRCIHFIILIILFLLGFFNFKIPNNEFNYFNILLFIFATLALLITYPLRRIAYANEKVTILQPFAMLYQVFPIIIGFIFIATERVNLITFLSALIASFGVILTSIDFKNLRINKYCIMTLISSCIKSIQIFATLYFLTLISPTTFYFTESIIIIIISIILILIKKEFREVKLLTIKYIKLLIYTNFIVIISTLLSLIMFSTLGIITTSLLNLLYLFFIYILGYFILNDIPSKKDIIVTIFVAFCIIIGIYYKV